ncbi:acyltransferase family protein [Dyadobacter sediminis]|uniref:Acyltransferase n=1 Tax=Dyadobacter sediminis TaxID=1493691 RepID=A0A5R9K6X2_9BACT|nr:acyltransferase [Dyadobacter sediminis]TLU89518.1 acyltransferase [Dyadobacter sediminis]GGC04703.1 acyltransferase [Dyadobacter sediminis]
MHSAPQKQSFHRIPELDALRGLAALSVVLFHFSGSNKNLLGWDFRFGVTGVDIFFMISGFVIFLTIQKIHRWQDFAVFRFARLYPAFWCCMLVTAVFMLVYEPENLSVTQLLANATMLPAYFSEKDLDGSYWTLLVEINFYLWILAVYMTGTLKRIEDIGFAFIILIVVFHIFSENDTSLHQIVVSKVQLANHFPLFYSGILFYQLFKGQKTVKNILLMVFSLLASFYLHSKGGKSMYYISAVEHCFMLVFYHAVFTLFIYGKLRFLDKMPLIQLGKISYCLYLIHQYAGLQLIATFTEVLHFNIYTAIVLALGLAVLLAYFANTFVEIPANELIRNWYKNRRSERLHANRTVA